MKKKKIDKILNTNVNCIGVLSQSGYKIGDIIVWTVPRSAIIGRVRGYEGDHCLDVCEGRDSLHFTHFQFVFFIILTISSPGAVNPFVSQYLSVSCKSCNFDQNLSLLKRYLG